MIYKVVSKGVVVEYTHNKKSADAAFSEAGRGSQMFGVFADGTAKFLASK